MVEVAEYNFEEQKYRRRGLMIQNKPLQCLYTIFTNMFAEDYIMNNDLINNLLVYFLLEFS